MSPIQRHMVLEPYRPNSGLNSRGLRAKLCNSKILYDVSRFVGANSSLLTFFPWWMALTPVCANQGGTRSIGLLQS